MFLNVKTVETCQEEKTARTFIYVYGVFFASPCSDSRRRVHHGRSRRASGVARRLLVHSHQTVTFHDHCDSLNVTRRHFICLISKHHLHQCS